jgi:tetratricopeptide (TPR) repeat protein
MNMLYRTLIIGAVVSVWTGLGGWSAAVAQDAEANAENFDCSRVGTLIEDATKEELRDAKLHFRSSKLYFTQELFLKSARSAELATHLDPTQARYWMRLALAYGQLGCYESSGDAFRTGLRITETDEKQKDDVGEELLNNQQFFHNARLTAGADLLDEDRRDDAMVEFQNAIAIDSTSVLAWRNLGVVMSKQEGVEAKEQALKAFGKALEFEPDNLKTQDFYRSVLANVAVERYNIALNDATSDDDATRMSAIAEMRKSTEMLGDAIEQGAADQELADLYSNTAMICTAIGQFSDEGPDQAAAYTTAIGHHRASAMARLGVDTPEVSEAMLHDDQDYLTNVLGCYAMLNDLDALLEYGGRLIDLNPRASDGYKFKAHALRESDRRDEALTFLLMEQCLSGGESVTGTAINGHIAGMITSYKPSDDIVKTSLTNLENPEEIRVKKDGETIYEIWIWWSKGYADAYYNGATAGKVEFKPVVES